LTATQRSLGHFRGGITRVVKRSRITALRINNSQCFQLKVVKVYGLRTCNSPSQASLHTCIVLISKKWCKGDVERIHKKYIKPTFRINVFLKKYQRRFFTCFQWSFLMLNCVIC